MIETLDDFTAANNDARAALLRLRARKDGFDLVGQRKRCRPKNTPFSERIFAAVEEANAKTKKGKR